MAKQKPSFNGRAAPLFKKVSGRVSPPKVTKKMGKTGK